MRWSILLAVPALAIGVAAPAWCDSNDDAFLKAIDGHGITYTNPQSMLTLAHAECKLLADGYSENTLVAQGELHGNSMSESDMKFIIHTAEAAYCPEQLH